MKAPTDKPKDNILLYSMLAALGYGAWAVFANLNHSTSAWVTAGVIQASFSFIATFFITQIAHKACAKCGYGKKGISIGYISSFIILLVVPYSIHSFSGTPNVWSTIMPGLIWGSIYLIGYLIALDKKEHKSDSK